eukprot:scaffold922_cov327-Pinguiococcus_pyrenoidosus.AAC.3
MAGALFLGSRTARGRRHPRVLWEAFCFLFTPMALLVGRLLPCEDGKLAVDPSLQCAGAAHVLVGWIGVVTFFVVAWDFLKPYVRQSSALIVYDATADHEKFLLALEVEYLLGITEDFDAVGVYYINDFRRAGAQLHGILLLRKAVLLFCYFFVREAQAIQVVIFYCALVAPLLYFLARGWPLRIKSGNQTFLYLNVWLAAVGMFGVLNGNRLRDPFLVASRESVYLILLTVLAAFICVVQIILRKLAKEQWPVDPVMRHLHAPENEALTRYAVICLKRAKEVLHSSFEVLHGSEEAKKAVLDSIRQIWNIWRVHKNLDSILEETTRGTLDQLVRAHQTWKVG